MKQHLNIAYKYQKEPLSAIGYGNDIEPNSPEFKLGSFTFRVLKNMEYGTLSYPKEIFIIGTSDKDNQVAFIYFRDFELDCIESLPDFLIGYCGCRTCTLHSHYFYSILLLQSTNGGIINAYS